MEEEEEEEERNESHFITYCNTDQRQKKEVWEMFFDILKFYLLLLYSTCPILFTTYFNSAAVYISESWLSVCQASRIDIVVRAGIRIEKEKEEEKGDLS